MSGSEAINGGVVEKISQRTGMRVVSSSQGFSLAFTTNLCAVMGETTELSEGTDTPVQNPTLVKRVGKSFHGHGCPFCNFLPRDSK